MQAKNQPNIILTGFMGTGKSTIGKLLAKRLGRRFIDTDQLIEEVNAMSIAELFAQRGEDAFRQLETQLAIELAEQRAVVIATGGGFLLNPINVEALESSGLIFCLTAAPEQILERLSADNEVSKRPLLAEGDPLERITQLLEQRAGQYGQFTQIRTDGLNPDEICDCILAAI